MKLEIASSTKVQTYRVNKVITSDGGKGVGKALNIAAIIFEDGKFKECQFQAKNPYTREQWETLALLNKMIAKIEKELSHEPKFD